MVQDRCFLIEEKSPTKFVPVDGRSIAWPDTDCRTCDTKADNFFFDYWSDCEGFFLTVCLIETFIEEKQNRRLILRVYSQCVGFRKCASFTEHSVDKNNF